MHGRSARGRDLGAAGTLPVKPVAPECAPKVAAFVTGEKPSVCCRNLRAGAEEGAFAAQLREHRGDVGDKGAGVLRAGFGRQTFELLAAGKVRRCNQPLKLDWTGPR